MNKTRIRQVHTDIVRYLENDCYCPYEVYNLFGFFYMLVKPDDECVVLGQNEKFILVAWDNQLLVVFKGKNKETIGENQEVIGNIERVDATENNIKELTTFVKDLTYKIKLIDEFTKGATKKALDEILSISDAKMYGGGNLILFLRKKEEEETPYYTIEYDKEKNSCVQVRGNRNDSATEEIMKFINKWQKKVKISLQA